jgi:predicted small secreted protein
MNKTSAALFAPLLAVSLMGAGCNPFSGVQDKINQKIGETIAEKIIETGSGGKVDVDADGGSFSFKDPKTGETVALGTNVKIPDGFPTDIPRYNGALPSIASLTKDQKRAVLAVTIFDVEPVVLAEWYEKQILANGYERKTSTPVTESLFNEYRKGNAKMIMTVLGQKDDSGKWGVSVQISREETAGNE